MARTSFLFRNKLVFIIIVTAILFSCSKTDEGDMPGGLKSTVPFDISLLAEENETIYQIDIFGNPEEKEVFNLSQTIGVPADFREVHIYEHKVTVFKKEGGYYSYWQKDLDSGNSFNRSPLCEPMEDEIWSFAETNGDQQALITITSSGSNQYSSYLRVYNPATDSCSQFYINDIYLETGLQALLHKEQLYLYTPEENIIDHSLTVINSTTGEQVKKLTFETGFQVSISGEKLYILFIDGKYKVYGINDHSLLEEGTDGNSLLFKHPGIYETKFKGSKMVFDYPYAQPALFNYGPAIYDWETKEITHGGDLYLADAIRHLQDQYQQALAYTTLEVNLESNIIVAGYKVLGEPGKGGVIYFNFDGEIIYSFPLDYIPFEIIIRE